MSDSRAFSQFEPPFESVPRSATGVAPAQPTSGQGYAIIRRYSGLDPRSGDEVERRVNAEVLPIISRIPGFVAYCALRTSGDVVASISIFEDQAGAEESTRQAASWIKQHLPTLVPSPVQYTAGRVIAYQVEAAEGRLVPATSRPSP
jgi:hypothetical protein